MEIKHDKEHQKFYLIADDRECSLKYILEDSKTFNILRVFVHPNLRNKGFAAELTKTALEYAKEINLKVVPSCSYADYFINQNNDYKELLA
jgi:predicted GNAT family acetyltransferase